jgi:hypothetical protein
LHYQNLTDDGNGDSLRNVGSQFHVHTADRLRR